MSADAANPKPAPAPKPTPGPAPTPTPPPAPTPPAPSPDFPTADVQPWLDHKHDHTLREERAADAVARWLASRR
jgi:hypothetical protein